MMSHCYNESIAGRCSRPSRRHCYLIVRILLTPHALLCTTATSGSGQTHKFAEMTSALCVMPSSFTHTMIQPNSSVACCPNSLLFPLEVEEEHRASCASSLQADQRIQRVRLCSQPEGAFAAQLVSDVRRVMFAQQQASTGDNFLNVLEMASSLSSLGYRVTVRTALGGGPACFRNLRHEFLTVLGEADYKDVPYIVDPAFKEQFKIPQPSMTYASLLEELPAEFVGTSSRLIPLVQNLCAEMVGSFEATNLTLPPWRRAQSMLTKWLPSRSKDTYICAHAADSNASVTTSCMGNSPTCSPTGADAEIAAGSSPFSRLDEQQVYRQGSGRSLLTGKFGSASSMSSKVLGRSSSSISSGSTSSSMQRTQPLVQMQSAAAILQHARMLPQQQQQQPLGTINRQPSLYQGQPPTYTVKMGAFAPTATQR